MAQRTATTQWQGGLTDGTGQVGLASSQAGGPYPVSFPKRAAEEAGGQTSPEELLAASHASCYAMALSNMLGQRGYTPNSIDVTGAATLSVSPHPHISEIALTVRAAVPGLDASELQQAASETNDNCPISLALAESVAITVDAQLA
jgi:osmotically inducible protein OsmC